MKEVSRHALTARITHPAQLLVMVEEAPAECLGFCDEQAAVLGVI
jgi:hypothetical protein